MRLFCSRVPPGILDETKRSVERPPSRFRAWEIFQPAGDWMESVRLRSARLHEEAIPIHQRCPPSWSRMERMATLLGSRPEMGLWFSMSKGPAWRSSLELETAFAWVRLEMEAWPDESM